MANRGIPLRDIRFLHFFYMGGVSRGAVHHWVKSPKPQKVYFSSLSPPFHLLPPPLSFISLYTCGSSHHLPKTRSPKIPGAYFFRYPILPSPFIGPLPPFTPVITQIHRITLRVDTQGDTKNSGGYFPVFPLEENPPCITPAFVP